MKIYASYLLKGYDYMNLILCSRNCRYQQDGYCCLEGAAVITNAAAAPCCYFVECETGK